MVVLFAGALMLPGLGFGQAETTGRISGTVVDEDGNPLGSGRQLRTRTGLDVLQRLRAHSQRG